MKAVTILIIGLSGILAQVQAQDIWGQVTVDTASQYPIKKEGQLYKTTSHGPKEIICADLIINGDSSKTIMSTSATMRGDTISILIFQTTPAYHHEYSIILVRGKYRVTYNFLTSGEEVQRKIRTLSSNLKLDSYSYKKGDTIKGFTEYLGKCVKGCWRDDYLIKGNFAVKIE